MKLIILSVFFFGNLTFSLCAQARSGNNPEWMKRSESREGSRWTLQGWLAQKERNQLMDIWLAMNSPSPYELSLQAGHDSYLWEQSTPRAAQTVEYTTYRGAFAAYAQIFGLTLEYENNTEEGFNDLSGSLNLRLLGNSIQNTHLNLSFGQRSRENHLALPSRTIQQFGDVSLEMHLNRHFGFIGGYRSFLPTNDISGGEISGSISKVGLFIDFGPLRIYGQRVQEISSGILQIQRTGIESGIQLFF